MKNAFCCISILVLTLLFISVGSANPNGEMKGSPLFKASLEKSIAKLEGKVENSVEAQTPEANMPTGRQICPNAPITQSYTCEPSYCGGSTCTGTCENTCQTCQGQSTCGNTCNQPTCANTCSNTCIGGSCQTNSFSGTVYWVIGSQSGNNWNSLPWPYSLYQGSAGGVWAQYDDEGSPGTNISGISASSGAYSGSRTRSTTSNGVTLRSETLVTDGVYLYSMRSATYISGPVPSSNYVNLYAY